MMKRVTIVAPDKTREGGENKFGSCPAWHGRCIHGACRLRVTLPRSNNPLPTPSLRLDRYIHDMFRISDHLFRPTTVVLPKPIDDESVDGLECVAQYATEPEYKADMWRRMLSLVDNGVDVNLQRKTGETFFLVAAFHRETDLMHLLIHKYNADVCVVVRKAGNPLQGYIVSFLIAEIKALYVRSRKLASTLEDIKRTKNELDNATAELDKIKAETQLATAELEKIKAATQVGTVELEKVKAEAQVATGELLKTMTELKKVKEEAQEAMTELKKVKEEARVATMELDKVRTEAQVATAELEKVKIGEEEVVNDEVEFLDDMTFDQAKAWLADVLRDNDKLRSLCRIKDQRIRELENPLLGVSKRRRRT